MTQNSRYFISTCSFSHIQLRDDMTIKDPDYWHILRSGRIIFPPETKSRILPSKDIYIDPTKPATTIVCFPHLSPYACINFFDITGMKIYANDLDSVVSFFESSHILRITLQQFYTCRDVLVIHQR